MSHKDRIRAFLKTDRAILMGCIGIALIVWIFMKMAQSHTTDVTVGVTYQLPGNKIFAETPPSSIKPEIKGTGWALFARYMRNLTPDISLSLADRPSQTISPAQLAAHVRQQLPYQVEVRPPSQSINVRLDDKAGKRVPLLLSKTPKFAPQFQASAPPILSPDSITIYGPASLIASVEHWTLESLPDDIKTDINQLVALRPHPNKQVSFSSTKITCTIPVEKFTEKTLSLPVAIINAHDSLLLTIYPAKINVTCRVGLSDYNTVTASEFKAIVDFTKVDVDNFNYAPVSLSKQSEQVSHVRLSPESVEFIISR